MFISLILDGRDPIIIEHGKFKKRDSVLIKEGIILAIQFSIHRKLESNFFLKICPTLPLG